MSKQLNDSAIYEIISYQSAYNSPHSTKTAVLKMQNGRSTSVDAGEGSTPTSESAEDLPQYDSGC